MPRHIGVEGHRYDAEKAGDPADRDRVQALGVGQGRGRGDDLVDGQALPGAVPGPRRRVTPQQLQGAGRIAAAGARRRN